MTSNLDQVCFFCYALKMSRSLSPFMRPALWRLFIELVEHGSLSKVALARDVAQPQVSRQLAELELMCGERLFSRHGRGVKLTEWGDWVLPRVRSWLVYTEQLENDIRSGAGVPIGDVRIAAMPSAIRPLLCPMLTMASTLYPLVRLSVQEALDSQMDEGLANGKFDLAIRYVHEKSLKENDQILQKVDSFLVGPSGDPLTANESVAFSRLSGIRMILPRRPSGWRETLDELARSQGFELNVTLEADSLILQKEMVMQQGYFTILGPLALEPELRQKRLQASLIVGPEVPRMVTLTVQGGPVTSLAQEVIAELIKKTALELPRNFFNPQQTRH